MTDNVIPFTTAKFSAEERAAHRQRFFHFRGQPVEEIDPALGTEEEWLNSAVDHLIAEMAKRNRIDRNGGGYIEASVAAVELVLQHIGELVRRDGPTGGDAA